MMYSVYLGLSPETCTKLNVYIYTTIVIANYLYRFVNKNCL